MARSDGDRCTALGHVLRTARLVLETCSPANLPEFAATVDAEVVRWQGYPEDPEALATLLAHLDGPRRREPYWESLLIRDRLSGEAIGSQSVWVEPENAGRCCTGGSIGAGWRDRGLGTEALRAVVALVHDHLGFPEVTAATEVTNLRAQAVYRKCGFSVVSEHVPHALPNGRVADTVVLARTAPATPACRYRGAGPAGNDARYPG